MSTDMATEFNELLPDCGDNSGHHPEDTQTDGDKMQIWLIGSRDQVVHAMNEFYVKRIATDRVQFTPIIPAPLFPGKYMSVLVR